MTEFQRRSLFNLKRDKGRNSNLTVYRPMAPPLEINTVKESREKRVLNYRVLKTFTEDITIEKSIGDSKPSRVIAYKPTNITISHEPGQSMKSDHVTASPSRPIKVVKRKQKSMAPLLRQNTPSPKKNKAISFNENLKEPLPQNDDDQEPLQHIMEVSSPQAPRPPAPFIPAPMP